MNYTVLVVDDEAEQRSALISRVDWSAAGFEVIGEAENGVEALDLIDALEPDLILTDIRMPMISGLELAAKVYEMRPATQIVILSGYDSFEYARCNKLQYHKLSSEAHNLCGNVKGAVFHTPPYGRAVGKHRRVGRCCGRGHYARAA